MTNQYPQGKLTEDDEAELPMKIGVARGRVVMGFGKPVPRVAMTGDGAVALAEVLIKNTRTVGSTRPVSIAFGDAR
jgi:hypothetical protein